MIGQEWIMTAKIDLIIKDICLISARSLAYEGRLCRLW